MKLDLLKKSLEMRKSELPDDSPAAMHLKEELANANSYSPVTVHYTSLQPFRDVTNNNKNHISSSTFSRCAAVTGKFVIVLVEPFQFFCILAIPFFSI